MSHWEESGKSSEWFTPRYIFDALGCTFDLDVASPGKKTVPWVPATHSFTKKALKETWWGFVWMNPPFGGRNGLVPWMDKFFKHGNGIALTPDRTSAPWWQAAARRSESILFISPKVKFLKSADERGESPSTGTTLLAVGRKGCAALKRAESKLGILLTRS